MALADVFGIGLFGALSPVVRNWAFSDAFSRPVQGPPAERL
ncbi:MAG TPA: hypothetical protein VEH82_06950 [Acidimicrobiales bacterium]|nr:hypothetical protein [Acidimicrobiales bacterium]